MKNLRFAFALGLFLAGLGSNGWEIARAQAADPVDQAFRLEVETLWHSPLAGDPLPGRLPAPDPTGLRGQVQEAVNTLSPRLQVEPSGGA